VGGSKRCRHGPTSGDVASPVSPGRSAAPGCAEMSGGLWHVAPSSTREYQPLGDGRRVRGWCRPGGRPTRTPTATTNTPPTANKQPRPALEPEPPAARRVMPVRPVALSLGNGRVAGSCKNASAPGRAFLRCGLQLGQDMERAGQQPSGVDCSFTEQRPKHRSMALMPAGTSEPAGHAVEVDDSGENPSVGCQHRIFTDSS